MSRYTKYGHPDYFDDDYDFGPDHVDGQPYPGSPRRGSVSPEMYPGNGRRPSPRLEEPINEGPRGTVRHDDRTRLPSMMRHTRHSGPYLPPRPTARSMMEHRSGHGNNVGREPAPSAYGSQQNRGSSSHSASHGYGSSSAYGQQQSARDRAYDQPSYGSHSSSRAASGPGNRSGFSIYEEYPDGRGQTTVHELNEAAGRFDRSFGVDVRNGRNRRVDLPATNHPMDAPRIYYSSDEEDERPRRHRR
jgi:hypothetical protein